MRELSLADVTNSDVDTQVILDLLKGRTDSDGLGGNDILSTLWLLTARLVVAYCHIQTWTHRMRVLISMSIPWEYHLPNRWHLTTIFNMK